MTLSSLHELSERFRGRDFLDFSTYTGEEIKALLDGAKSLKILRQQGEQHLLLQGKTLGMIFDKASTRTRVSFEVGMFELGGHALFLANDATQLGRGEPIIDTARVLSRYLQAIMIRTFAHQSMEELATYATIPIINGLTDEHHPCQVLADLLTIEEKKGHFDGVTIAYVGDGNNMAHSLLQAAPLVGMNIRVATPSGYEPDATIVAQAKMSAKSSGTEILVTNDPYVAALDADVIYTDVWASMGQEESAQKRINDFSTFQVNDALFEAADDDAIFLHCLPAHRGEEVTESVLEGAHSVVFDQAENRLHVQKAVMVAVIG